MVLRVNDKIIINQSVIISMTINEDDIIELDNEILETSRKLGVDDEEADGLISLLDEVKDEIEAEGVDVSEVPDVKHSKKESPYDSVGHPVGYSGEEEDEIESIDEIESMQEIESIEPIKSIQEIKSIQNIKSIQEVPDAVAKEFIEVWNPSLHRKTLNLVSRIGRARKPTD